MVVVVVDGTEVVVDDEDIRALLPADATLALLVAMIHRPRVSESVSVTPHLAETLPPAAMPRRGAGHGTRLPSARGAPRATTVTGMRIEGLVVVLATSPDMNAVCMGTGKCW